MTQKVSSTEPSASAQKAISPTHFCSACLHGCLSVLKIGCSVVDDIPLVLQNIENLTAIDIDPATIAQLQKEGHWTKPCTFRVLDITDESLDERFDAAYSLDTLDRIPASLEHRFIANICRALKPKGIFILGAENATTGKMNPKTGPQLKQLLELYFEKVSIFSWTPEGILPGYQEAGSYALAVAEDLTPQNSWLTRGEL